MTHGRPSDTAPTAWYEAARNVDQNRASNEAFCSTHRTPTSLPSHLRPPTQPSPRLLTITQAHVKPTPGNPVPMDIDASRRKTSIPPTCYRCGNIGHKVPDCLRQYDIRVWSVEDLEAELQLRLAMRDVVPPEDCPTVSEEEVAAEGFPQDNE